MGFQSLLVLVTFAVSAYALPTFGPATIINKRQIAASYDYIIVGAGTAGLTLGARLSEDPSGNPPHAIVFP